MSRKKWMLGISLVVVVALASGCGTKSIEDNTSPKVEEIQDMEKENIDYRSDALNAYMKLLEDETYSNSGFQVVDIEGADEPILIIGVDAFEGMTEEQTECDMDSLKMYEFYYYDQESNKAVQISNAEEETLMGDYALIPQSYVSLLYDSQLQMLGVNANGSTVWIEGYAFSEDDQSFKRVMEDYIAKGDISESGEMDSEETYFNDLTNVRGTRTFTVNLFTREGIYNEVVEGEIGEDHLETLVCHRNTQEIRNMELQ